MSRRHEIVSPARSGRPADHGRVTADSPLESGGPVVSRAARVATGRRAARPGRGAGHRSVALLVAILGAGCGGAGVPAGLQTVPPPDLARLSEPLRQQVGSRWEALAERIEAGGPAAELAGAYGDAGLILMAAEFEEAALACLRNAATLAPDDPRWPYYLGRFHLLRGEQAQAPAFFERAYALRPTDVPTLLQLGEARLDQGRPDDAAERFREALRLEPRSAAALWGPRPGLAGG